MTSTKNDQFCDKFCDNFFPKSLLYESQTKWVDTNEKRKKPWIYHKMLKKEGNKKLGTHFSKVNHFGVEWEGACFTGKTSLGRPSYKTHKRIYRSRKSDNKAFTKYEIHF